MWSWTAEDLAAITGGVWEVLPPEGWVVKALAFTKKRLTRQALIIPKCRTYMYGVGLHKLGDFVDNGYALLIEDDIIGAPHNAPRIRVRSIRDAVAKLAVSSRATYPGRVVAVTGSVGKSSSVSMIGDMLWCFGIPKRPTVNFNTFDGVNSEIANLGEEAVAVIEVAASFLSRVPIENLCPDVAMITNIGEAHLEHFGSLQGIAKVKSNVFDLMHRGTAVIPRDSDVYGYLVDRAHQAMASEVSFGVDPKSDARLLSYSTSRGLVEAAIFGEKITYRLGVLGRHMALNSVGALAVIAVLGLDWRRAAGALATSTEMAGRGAVFVVELEDRNFTVIDNAYNANPTSMRASLEMLSERPLAGSGRRVAILADMLELGPDSERLHVALADSILRLGIDRVHLVGPLMRSLWEVLPPQVRGCYLSSAVDLWAVLKPDIADGDVLLFKGSNGTNLHKVVAEVRNTSKRKPPDHFSLEAKMSVAMAAAPSQGGAGRPRQRLIEMRMVTAEESSQPLARLVFLGDVSLGDAYLTNPRLSDELQRLGDDPWSFVELLAPLVEDKSLLIANLETVLAERPADPFGGRKGYQGWDRPERTLSILKHLRVDAVSLANNHTMDFGAAPLMATIAHLNTAGISAFGAGADEVQAAQPLSYAAPFGNVHIFAGFEFRANYARKYGFYASSDMPGVNPLSHGAAHFVAAAVARIRASDPSSIIIVYPHWSGPANYGWANEEMVSLGEIFVSKGADLVIGHGAHRMQEVLSDPKGTTVFSLGNFVFNSPGRYRKYDAPPFSLVARLDLAQQGSGCAGSLRLYPIVSDNRVTSFRPRPVTESEASAVCASLRAREQSVGSFDKAFSLGQDGRGWFLEATAALSPRITRLSAVEFRALG